METTRRFLFAGLGAVLAAPAIVRATSIMPIKMAWEDKLFIRAYEHIHPASFGVPQSGWVNEAGLPLQGCPDQIWTWGQFLEQLKSPNPHPNLRPSFASSSWPYNRELAFDVGVEVGHPNWVGWYDPKRRRVASGDA